MRSTLYSIGMTHGNQKVSLEIYAEAGAQVVYIPWLIFSGANTTINGGIVGQFTRRINTWVRMPRACDECLCTKHSIVTSRHVYGDTYIVQPRNAL